MNLQKAQTLAREFVCRKIEISPCEELPEDVVIYNFDPAGAYVFTVRRSGHYSVGAEEYVAVDRGSGEVRHLGFHGE